MKKNINSSIVNEIEEKEEQDNFWQKVEKEGIEKALEKFPNVERKYNQTITMVNKRIKELRIENGLSQMDLAKVFQMTQKEYWRMEQEGYSVNILNLANIAIFYNISIDWFSGYYPERKPFFENTENTIVNGYTLKELKKKHDSK